jgi:hypothetical protein
MKTVLVSFLFLVVFHVAGRAQQQQVHEKKMFVSSDGKLYINKALPVYLRLATSPDDDASSILLRSEKTSAYSNPMYFDTEGINTVRSPSAVDTATKNIVYPMQDIIFEVYADSRPPVTSIDYGSTSVHEENDKLYVNGEVKIELSARDITSGVSNIYYSVDKKDYVIYNEPFLLNEEKEYNLKYYAVDNVGNVESLEEVTLVLDKSNPVSKIEIEGDLYENILSGRSKIILVSDDNGIGTQDIYYILDDNPKKEYKYPIYTKYLKQGNHILRFFAKDKVNNQEKIQEYEFYVDKTPPTIVEEVIGKSFVANGKEFSSGRSKLKLTTFDNKAGVKEIFYSINGEEFQKYDKPFYLSNTSGNLKIKTYALDNVNNKTTNEEESSKSSIPFIDLAGPALYHEFKGPVFTLRDTIFISNKTKILLRAKDSESGLNRIEYNVDNGDFQEYTDPIVIDSEGYHEVFFNGFDNVENSNRGSIAFMVDTTGPDIYSRFSIPPAKANDETDYQNYPEHVVLFLSATDVFVGFEEMFYSINGEQDTPCNGLIKNFQKDKQYSIKVKATDKLGNQKEDIIHFNTTN